MSIESQNAYLNRQKARKEYRDKLKGLRSLLDDTLLQLVDLETSRRDRDWSDVGTLNVAFEHASSLLGSLQALDQ